MSQKSFRKITKTEIPQTLGTCKKSRFTPQSLLPTTSSGSLLSSAPFVPGTDHSGSHPVPSAEPSAPRGPPRKRLRRIRLRPTPTPTRDLRPLPSALAALESGPASRHPSTRTATSRCQDLTWNLGPVCQPTAEAVQYPGLW